MSSVSAVKTAVVFSLCLDRCHQAEYLRRSHLIVCLQKQLDYFVRFQPSLDLLKNRAREICSTRIQRWLSQSLVGPFAHQHQSRCCYRHAFIDLGKTSYLSSIQVGNNLKWDLRQSLDHLSYQYVALIDKQAVNFLLQAQRDQGFSDYLASQTFYLAEQRLSYPQS